MVDGVVVSDKFQIESVAANDYIRIYQKYISRYKSGICAMHPSCSNFGLTVFGERNFFDAAQLTADRLIRCSHDSKFYDYSEVYGASRLVDFPFYKSVKKQDFIKQSPCTDILKTHTDSTFLFVNHLINSGDYNSALLEIKRVQFSKKLPDYYYSKKLLCYRGLGEYEKGVYEFETQFSSEIKNREDVLLEVAKCYYLLENYNMALMNLQYIINNDDISDVQRDANVLKALSYVRLEKFDKSIRCFSLNNNVSHNKDVCHNNVMLVGELSNIDNKSPSVARFISIVPGLGYLYTGHKGSALTAFLANSLLAYATYTSIKSENYGVAGLMGFVSLSFYIGNISGAGRSAVRYNKKQRESIFTRLERSNFIFQN